MLAGVLLDVIEAAVPIDAAVNCAESHGAIGDVEDGVIGFAIDHFDDIRVSKFAGVVRLAAGTWDKTRCDRALPASDRLRPRSKVLARQIREERNRDSRGARSRSFGISRCWPRSLSCRLRAVQVQGCSHASLYL